MFIHSSMPASKSKKDINFGTEKNVMDIVYSIVMIEILHKKEVYSLHEFLEGSATVSKVHVSAEPAINSGYHYCTSSFN